MGKFLINYFGESNVFIANSDETFELTSNVLVISPDVIVSNKKFNRLNSWLENKGVIVEKVDYSNVSSDLIIDFKNKELGLRFRLGGGLGRLQAPVWKSTFGRPTPSMT